MEAPDWTESVQVEEKNLQEYLCQKQHTMVLQGAVHTLQHTLVSVRTTRAGDGFVHFGDMLILCSACTRGLLQVDPAAAVTVNAGSIEVQGCKLSTGSVISSCPRSNFTVGRVDDNDSHGTDTCVYYGQLIRLGTHEALADKPCYLYASTQSSDDGSGQVLISVCPRAAEGSHWRVCRGSKNQADAQRDADDSRRKVELGDLIRLESVATGCELQSNGVVIMTSYGNEYEVFGSNGHVPGGRDVDRGRSFEWSFLDDHLSEQALVAAQKKHEMAVAAGARTFRSDPVAMLQDPLYRAETQLAEMDEAGAGEKRYAVLARIYPILRNSDMHTIRRLRRMCEASDEEGVGVIGTHIFHGLLSWVCIRLTKEEARQLQTLFGCDSEGKPLDPCDAPEGERDLLNYRRFFRLMGATMRPFRLSAVKDAFKKLEDNAIAKMVDITHLQKLFCATAHPKVQDGSMSIEEAREEFFRQWELDHPEGRITWEAFRAYYDDVSLAVADDQIFVELVRSSWNL